MHFLSFCSHLSQTLRRESFRFIQLYYSSPLFSQTTMAQTTSTIPLQREWATLHPIGNPDRFLFRCSASHCGWMTDHRGDFKRHYGETHGSVVAPSTRRQPQPITFTPPLPPVCAILPTTAHSSTKCSVPQCGKAFQRPQEFYRHYREEHVQERFQCTLDDCHESFKRRYRLEEHIRQDH